MTALDERIIAYNKEETHRESSVQKVSSSITQYYIMFKWCSQVGRLEKQLQKTQQHNEQQKNIIAQLKAQKYDVDQVKVFHNCNNKLTDPHKVHIDRAIINHWEINYRIAGNFRRVFIFRYFEEALLFENKFSHLVVLQKINSHK